MTPVHKCSPSVNLWGRHGDPVLSEAIGGLIAEIGFHLLTGGGSGVMADASPLPNRADLTLGIIPRSATCDETKEGSSNPWIEFLILPSPATSAPKARHLKVYRLPGTKECE